MTEQRIAVAVRIRPTIERERYEPVCARKADDDQTIIIKPEESAANMGEAAAFQFDFVFDEHDDQSAVYEESVQELVDHSLSGFNTTVFTYGQTGSGKTYTILGSMSDDGTVTAQSGMFLRVFHDLFTYKASMEGRMHIIITLSALELYVEEVMDLLSSKKKLKLRESPEETLTMGITTVEVRTMADVVSAFRVANSFRSVTATKMNDSSSRSHALFFIDLFQVPTANVPQAPTFPQLIDDNGIPIRNSVPGLVRSRMVLVDLAGSERVKRSGVAGQAMVEAQAINKSLSTLGTVINAMYVQNPHIPFRESKLTKLLKPSFVETTSRLLLIGQISPPTNSAQESLGTLRFCDRVKGLKAGQVGGFSDPAEEERFLASLRTNEELTAELRILAVQYYHTPTNLRALAAAKGTTAQQEQAAVVESLRTTGPERVTRKEQEALAKIEAEATAQQDAEVEQFVLRMNSLIEEYEQVAVALKKEKKSAKKLKEEWGAEQEARTHETKKAKKYRLKVEETCEELKVAVAQAAQEESQVVEAIAQVKAAPVDAGPNQTTNPSLSGATEEATHALVASFYAHATEQNRLYSLYMTRVAATGRQRTQVRRMKLLSSTLVTEGTLLYDIIGFLVERAVDIAEGDVPSGARWNWHDVDGLSNQLRGADQLFPPLLPSRLPKRSAAFDPCKEAAHTITFLSSDDSDAENSHHAMESRRQRRIVKKNGEYGSSTFDDLLEGEELGREQSGNEEDSDSGTDGSSNDEGEPPVPVKTAWMAGDLDGDDGAAAAAAGETSMAPPEEHPLAAATTRKRKRRKRNSSAEVPVEDVPPALAMGVAGAGGMEEGNEEDGGIGREGTPNRPPQKEKRHRRGLQLADGAEHDNDAEGNQADTSGAIATPVKRRKAKRPSDSAAGVSNESEEEEEGEEEDREGEAENPKHRLKTARKLTKAQEGERYLQQVYDSPTLVQDLIKFLRVGTVMLKHGRHGKPHRRLFWVSTARGKKELLWMEPNARNSDRSSIHLDAVSYIQLGSFGKVFKRYPVYPNNPAFFRCFTIGLKSGGRTVDIVADSMPDFEAWVVGLSYLVGVDPAWGGKLDVTREPGFDRLTFFESGLCETNYIFPSDYLALKKAIQRKATKTLHVLEQCGNDPVAAHAILGGIHPPAINDKGALYFTKGELRFLLPTLGLDIFRLSRVWILLQQMNLIYDDKFVPATAFGVTKRE